mmetsp:Transcript_72909/g.191138  ORF Transcript_72909/g.191138 Transcript_72909/m.191138 type:complete len:222 (+) Transcript_72909:289-954(+)
MPEGDDLILGAVHDVGRTRDLADLVHIREHVAGQRDARVQGHAVDGQQRALEHHGPDGRLRGQVDGRARADRAAVQHNLLPRDADDVPEVLEGRLDVGVDGLLVRLARAHAVACVLVGEDVDFEYVAHLAKVLDDHAQVFGVAVAEEERELSIAVDEEGGDHLLLRGGEPYQVGVLGVRGVRRLEDNLRDRRAHGSPMRLGARPARAAAAEPRGARPPPFP